MSSVDFLQYYGLQALGNNNSAVVQEEILVKSELTLHLPINLSITFWYFVRSAAEISVDASVSSACSPMQYRNVLTCLLSSSEDSPDARRNCSNRLFQRGHSSGFRNSKGEGGCNRTLAILSLLTPCRILWGTSAVTSPTATLITQPAVQQRTFV